MDRARSIHKAVLSTSCFARFPVSAQPWKHANPFAFIAAAKCAPIDSAIRHCAPLAITAHKKGSTRQARDRVAPAARIRGPLARSRSIHRDDPARRASRRLMPATTVAASRRAMTIAERQPLGRPATQMTQPAASARLTPSAAPPRSTASHSASPGPSTVWSLQNRPEPAEDRNTGPECGSVPHSGSSGRDSPEAQPRAEWAERGTFRPPGHSAGAAECSAARMATLKAADGRPSRACSGRTPWPGTARRRRAGRSGGDAVRQARQWP
jgi:hypothetical protein